MKTVIAAALAASFAFCGAASAQTYAPQVPNPSNPFPPNPIATDGTPLRRAPDLNPTVYEGRSAFVPGSNPISGVVGGVGDVVGSTVGAATGLVGSGLGTAGGLVGAVGAGAPDYGR